MIFFFFFFPPTNILFHHPLLSGSGSVSLPDFIQRHELCARSGAMKSSSVRQTVQTDRWLPLPLPPSKNEVNTHDVIFIFHFLDTILQ